MRKLCAGVLLAVCAAGSVGCAVGYVTYFKPQMNGAPVPHRDPYMRPPPPAGAELSDGALSIGCTNIRKFMLLPIPWLRRGFRPMEMEVELGFPGQPDTVRVELGAMGATIDGVARRPLRIQYEGRRPAPRHVETTKLPVGGRARLDAPIRLVLVFDDELRSADRFQVTVGEIDVDGRKIRLPPLAFEREGDFVVYRSPAKKKAPPSDEMDVESSDVF
jgi:hypothetical protein